MAIKGCGILPQLAGYGPGFRKTVPDSGLPSGLHRSLPLSLSVSRKETPSGIPREEMQMVTITVQEYFAEEGPDTTAALCIESDAIGPEEEQSEDDRTFIEGMRAELRHVVLTPTAGGTLRMEIAAATLRNPALRKGLGRELEGIIAALTDREETRRRQGLTVREANRLLDHLVLSLQEKGEGQGRGEGQETERGHQTRRERNPSAAPAGDASSIISQLMAGDTEIPAGHKWYDTAIARNPEDAMAWNAKGEAMAAAGRVKEAEECFTRALAIDPEYKDARYNLNHVGRMGRVG